MRRIFFVFLGMFGIYVLVVFAWAGLSYGSQFSRSFESLERRLNPAKVLFWQSVKLWIQPPSVPEEINDPKGFFVFEEVAGFSDVDVWFLMLDGFDDIRNVSIADDLRIDIEKVAESEPGTVHYTRRSGIYFRVAAFPIGVKRTEFHIADMRHWFDHYKHECLDQMVLDRLHLVEHFWSRQNCERVSE